MGCAQLSLIGNMIFMNVGERRRGRGVWRAGDFSVAFWFIVTLISGSSRLRFADVTALRKLRERPQAVQRQYTHDIPMILA